MLSRRGFLAGGTAGVAALTAASLTGCSVETPLGVDRPRRPATPSPDVAVATTALLAVRGAVEALKATVAALPATRGDLVPLLSMHRTHLATLVDAVPDGSAPSPSPAAYVVPRGRPAALRAVRRREEQLLARLGELAVQAQSGEFARLLAAMGAGTQQRLAASGPTEDTSGGSTS